MTPTGIKIIAADGTATNATAAVPFWVEVDYNYVNPNCSNYIIQYVVNGWTNITAPVNYGCGYTGTTDWEYDQGPWIMYKPGKYTISLTVDSGNAITKTAASKTFTTNVTFGGAIIPQWGLIDVEFGRTNLGPGTDVIVGTMDDAFDFNHPWFTGNDSRGRPRLIKAVQNALGVDGSPINDAHSTGVMGCVLARGVNDGDITGLAPDARYISAEFLNRANISGLPELDVLDAVNIMLTNGAQVINMPWSYWTGDDLDSETGEAPITDLMADYLAYASNIFCVAYANELVAQKVPTAPGAARNVITVGGLADGLVRAWEDDDFGPTPDGRCKPDILGDLATNCIAPSSDWRDGFPDGAGFWGNSFAGPFMTGSAVQMVSYSIKHGVNRDHRLLKAILMNSGVVAEDDNGAPWTNSPTAPMDYQQGTGILNLERVYGMYSAGQQATGPVAVPGYDFATITNGPTTYLLGSPSTSSADLDVTMAWDRHTFWSDLNGDGQIDAGDTFYTNPDTDAQSILNLTLYRDGVAVAQSISAVDTIQHLHLTNLTPGAYQLSVQRVFVQNATATEPYGLAWYSTVPWTNLPPKIASVGATLGAGNTASFQVQLASGQANNFQLQETDSLVKPIVWTPVANPTWVQTGPNTYQAQVPFSSGASHFYRIGAAQ